VVIESEAVDVQPFLTRREREVVNLLTRGLTNREIAEALVIATPTAERHVANILNKVGLRSRTEVAVWALAYEPRLSRPRVGLIHR
jgi:non-specific serine/threonine protein kinase